MFRSRSFVTFLMALVFFHTLSPLQAEPRLRALDPARFFANPAVQAQKPLAFAVQAVSVPVLEALDSIARDHRAALVAAIRADEELARGVRDFPTLGWPERSCLLRRLVELECAVMGAQVPPFEIHEEEDPGRRSAFFEFDPDQGGTGIVHLWPKSFADDPSPYAPLLLTLHETRHSWQFQVAFGQPDPSIPQPVVEGFAAGFRAQKELSGRLSFCDFCTMHHEHEAFQTGNQVVGELTGWTADTAGMGCWSSQFDGAGTLRIDLLDLARRVGADRLLEAFNEAERGQFQEMGG